MAPSMTTCSLSSSSSSSSSSWSWRHNRIGNNNNNNNNGERNRAFLLPWWSRRAATTTTKTTTKTIASSGKEDVLRRDNFTYPPEYLDLGPRIKKALVESNEFDPEMYDLVCDVRSPSEYKDDHVPFAISTPVLSDQQREEIGTMYVQVDPFEAKKLGAKLTSENLSKILEEHFLHLPKTTKVCVYCFRGGERSLSLAHVLSRIGFDVSYVPGGYKKYRETTLKYLKEEAAKFRYHVVAGKTGCAKGKLLDALEKRGAQVIDLERFAEHRGSVLGEDPENGFVGQPSQKMFDSRLAHKMRKFDEKRVIFVEGESSMIGKVQIPTMTWKRMGEGKATILSIPMEHRVKWIRQNYEHFETTEVPRLLEKLQVLEKRVGNERVNQWRSLVAEKKWDQFVEEILVHHYDRAYDQASKRSRPNDFDEESGERKGADQGGADELFLENLEEQTYDKAAEDLMEKYDKVL
ncbi:unnamed protein product [Bathycoccus prasinos]